MISLPVENIADTLGLADHHLHTAERKFHCKFSYYYCCCCCCYTKVILY